MKKILRSFAALALAFLVQSGTGHAKDKPPIAEVKLGTPVLSGTGCNKTNASAVLSPDAESVSILYDQYRVEVGRTAGKLTDRKACRVLIPVSLPKGYRVGVVGIDNRGFNSLPKGGESQFSFRYTLGNKKGPQYLRKFQGPLNDSFLEGNPIAAADVFWSSCGGRHDLEIESELSAKSSPSGETTLVTVDSTDLSTAAIAYQLVWKKCGQHS